MSNLGQIVLCDFMKRVAILPLMWYVVLLKEARHMTELLKTLYWNLYTPHENQEAELELDDCHQQLIEVLDKPERKLVLRIIDGKDRLADEIGLDSFIFGFKLATQLAHELKKYNGHLHGGQTADEDVRCSIMTEEEN